MKAPKTRNAGTMTESQFFSMIRSGLRKTFRFWRPITETRLAARRAYSGENKRQKWEYKCAACEGWFKGAEVQVDHIVPCGSLRNFEDIPLFLERLSTEDGYQVLCRECHQALTNKERGIRETYPREESSYRNMQSRCNNSNSTGYHRYGGRGISVCPEWTDDFFQFYKDMGPRPEGTSIDRIDYDGNYCKENCRWATSKIQCNNTSSNVYLTHGDEVLTLTEWADELGIKSNTITYRLLRGWSTEEALEMVPRHRPAYNGRMTEEELEDMVSKIDAGMSRSEWGRQNGLDNSQVSRLYRKFSKTNKEREERCVT